MYKGMFKEKKLIFEKLNTLLKIQFRLLIFKSILEYVLNLSHASGGVLAQIFIFFEAFFNLITFNAKTFQTILTTFDQINTSFTMMMRFITLEKNISFHAGYTARVGQLLESFETLKKSYEGNENCYEYILNVEKNESDNLTSKIDFLNCEITTPDESKVLVENLNVNFYQNNNLLIMGPSGKKLKLKLKKI
jgi:ABC-type uncharacterized transport system fused permease/ATPase subunit